MEIKAELIKPYTEEQRLDFIINQNYTNGFEIRETETELQAWGYTTEELEQQNKELQELYIELSKRVDNLDKKKSKGKLTIIPTKIDEEAADSEFTVVSESTQNSEE